MIGAASSPTSTNTLVVDSAHRITHGTAPMFAELGFGFIEESIEAVEIALPDGRTLRVRGRIDRVDLGRDGTIHVVDYKTGSYHQGYRDILSGDPVGGGTKLQLPIYGLAGRVARHAEAPVRAEYWFVTTRGGFARCGYEITETCWSARSRCSTSSCAASTTACSRPTRRRCRRSSASPATCATRTASARPSCASSGIAKRDDPALRAYADLAEPLEERADA